MEDFSEKEIIIKIQNGKINYFELLVNKYSRIIYFFTLKKVQDQKDAEDIVQNTFINVYKAIEKFDINRSFYPFLFSVLKTEIAKFYRNHKKHFQLEEKLLSQENLKTENIDLELILKTLKNEYSGVLKLYYIEGFSYKEIAVELKKPVNTVRTLIRRAKIEARKNYEK